MGIPIKRETDHGPSWSWLYRAEQERCCVCRVHTSTWSELHDRTPGEQVAICEPCAEITAPELLPTKSEWFAKERALEKKPWQE